MILTTPRETAPQPTFVNMTPIDSGLTSFITEAKQNASIHVSVEWHPLMKIYSEPRLEGPSLDWWMDRLHLLLS